MNSPGSGKVETGSEKVETTRNRRQNRPFPISTLIFKGLSSNIVLGQTAIIILCDTGSPINGKQKCSFFNQTESHIDNIWMFKERNGVGKKTWRQTNAKVSTFQLLPKGSKVPTSGGVESTFFVEVVFIHFGEVLASLVLRWRRASNEWPTLQLVKWSSVQPQNYLYISIPHNGSSSPLPTIIT